MADCELMGQPCMYVCMYVKSGVGGASDIKSQTHLSSFAFQLKDRRFSLAHPSRGVQIWRRWKVE